MLKLIFFWGANAFEALATIFHCTTGHSGLDLIPLGGFLLAFAAQMLFAKVISWCCKWDYHTVNTVCEGVLVAGMFKSLFP
jgi:hypothetical protein